ncbi:MAG: phosphodiesterase [Sphingobium sp.]
MLIAQITDLHIRPGEDGRRNDARLLQVLDRVADAGPDLVIATGDLTDEGDEPSYRRLRQLLGALPMDVHLALGNHDCRAAMLRVFPETPVEDGLVQYVIDSGARRIIVLDTLAEGRHGGHFSPAQGAWLAARLAEAPDRPTLIALHHPPVDSGIGWMDAESEEGWAAPLEAAVAGHMQVAGYITGHIHRPSVAQFGGRPLVIGSSTAPQVALDLALMPIARGDGRPLIVEEAPGFVLHRWTAQGLVSHFADARDNAVLARHADMLSIDEADPMAWHMTHETER